MIIFGLKMSEKWSRKNHFEIPRAPQDLRFYSLILAVLGGVGIVRVQNDTKLILNQLM